MDIDYPSASGTASLSWAAIQEVKRPLINTFPNLASEMSASAAELHSLIGLGGTTVAQMLADLSATMTTQKYGVDDTATAAVEWDGSAKYVQSDTPALATEGDLWFQL